MKLSQAFRKSRTIQGLVVGQGGVRRGGRGEVGCPSRLLGFSPLTRLFSLSGLCEKGDAARERGTRPLPLEPLRSTCGRRPYAATPKRATPAVPATARVVPPPGRQRARWTGGAGTPSERFALLALPG